MCVGVCALQTNKQTNVSSALGGLSEMLYGALLYGNI